MAWNRPRNERGPGTASAVVRGELVPIVHLGDRVRAGGGVSPRSELLLTRHSGRRVAVAVDRLLGRVQTVVQPLSDDLASAMGFYSGATILGDGAVALVLDLAAVVLDARQSTGRHRYPPFDRSA